MAKPLIKESVLKALVSNGIKIDCDLVPRRDRTFEVRLHYADREAYLQTYDGEIRSFVDPVRVIDWAKRIGLQQITAKIDLKRWPD